MDRHPVREATMPGEPGLGSGHIAGINDHHAICSVKKVGHVLVKGVILHQMQYDVH